MSYHFGTFGLAAIATSCDQPRQEKNLGTASTYPVLSQTHSAHHRSQKNNFSARRHKPTRIKRLAPFQFHTHINAAPSWMRHLSFTWAIHRNVFSPMTNSYNPGQKQVGNLPDSPKPYLPILRSFPDRILLRHKDYGVSSPTFVNVVVLYANPVPTTSGPIRPSAGYQTLSVVIRCIRQRLVCRRWGFSIT
jgi:hypothetical protein